VVVSEYVYACVSVSVCYMLLCPCPSLFLHSCRSLCVGLCVCVSMYLSVVVFEYGSVSEYGSASEYVSVTVCVLCILCSDRRLGPFFPIDG